MVFGLRSWAYVFFTIGTLFAFRGRFSLFDSLLKFVLQDLIDKLPPFDEEKVIKIMHGPTVGSVLGDLIAIGEQGVEFFMKQGANIRGGDSGMHKNLLVNISVKTTYLHIVPVPGNIDTPSIQ